MLLGTTGKSVWRKKGASTHGTEYRCEWPQGAFMRQMSQQARHAKLDKKWWNWTLIQTQRKFGFRPYRMVHHVLMVNQFFDPFARV